MLSADATVELANGVRMPRLGLGTYKSAPGAEVEDSVRWAVEAGYRLIDTAALYGNERDIGEAISASAIPREEIFVTTKVWNTDQGYDSTWAAFEASLAKLATSYVDLYLVHWPIRATLEPTWRAMEEIYASGRARAIGVCNFLQPHLEALLGLAEVTPMVNQFELHPWLQQKDLCAFLAERRIVVQAWAPVMRGRAGEVPELVEIARAHGKTPSQVCIRWALQQGFSAVPKSVHQKRVIENADVFDFELTPEQMATISTLDADLRFGGHHPDDVWCGRPSP